MKKELKKFIKYCEDNEKYPFGKCLDNWIFGKKKKHPEEWFFYKRLRNKNTIFGKMIKKSKLDYTNCLFCGRNEDITIDHLVPVSLFRIFYNENENGNNNIIQMCCDNEDNLRFLCRECNLNKGRSIDFQNPLTYKIIREVLDRAEKYFIEK